jgi:hypothetical protein
MDINLIVAPEADVILRPKLVRELDRDIKRIALQFGVKKNTDVMMSVFKLEYVSYGCEPIQIRIDYNPDNTDINKETFTIAIKNVTIAFLARYQLDFNVCVWLKPSPGSVFVSSVFGD